TVLTGARVLVGRDIRQAQRGGGDRPFTQFVLESVEESGPEAFLRQEDLDRTDDLVTVAFVVGAAGVIPAVALPTDRRRLAVEVAETGGRGRQRGLSGEQPLHQPPFSGVAVPAH